MSLGFVDRREDASRFNHVFGASAAPFDVLRFHFGEDGDVLSAFALMRNRQLAAIGRDGTFEAAMSRIVAQQVRLKKCKWLR